MTRSLALLLCLGLLAAGGTAWAEDASSPDPPNDSAPPATLPMGVHRISDEQGKAYIVYTTGGSDETQSQAEEDRLRSWKMLEDLSIFIKK
ncbi:MAG: hypothetical protein JRC92_04175 [Deltaproteobacteria bacterium]|nr:hypothetical protein [Deltaproteobacteria bacterium]